MFDNRAAKVAELFKSAVELLPEKRQVFLDARCGADSELRAEVESLLRTQARAGQFLERPAANLASGNARAGAFTPGEAVGDYEIVSLIARGGMGEVYLANDRRVQRQIALKFVRGGLDRDTLTRRFHREQELLAALNHPNIAQLYDTGVTGYGIPYFVMEYVNGLRLDDFVAQQSLGLTDRLRLFQKLCGAVAYAHQHLVIHRDIKPANIRVTPGGEPKLLDFGIAKLLDNASARESDQTATLQRILTPEYASPEQIRGDRLSTATDVYSLGVVLYELLTGTKPYRVQSRRPDELERAVADQEPVRPSTAAAASSKSHALNPKALQGDLDNILLKALRKEPERRYATAAQFSDDIQRHLTGLPVSARKDTLRYRTARFVGRNRFAVAAAIVIACTIIAGLIATTWQARVARRNEARAERINQFLQRMLSFSNQSITSVAPVPQRKDVTVNQMLDLIVPQIESELSDAPEVRAQVLQTIGTAYASQGLYDAAEKQLRAALEAQNRIHGRGSEEAVSTMIELGVLLYRKFELEEAGRHLDAAIAYYRKQTARNLPVASTIQFILALDYLATVKLYQGDVGATRSLIEEALRICSGITLQGHQRGVSALTQGVLGAVLVNLGELDKAETALRQSLTEYRALSPQASWEEGATIGYLGNVAAARNQLEEADKLLLEAERILRQTLGERNVYVASCLNRQANLCLRKRDFSAAEKKALESLSMFQEALPDKRLIWATPMQTLGIVLTETGRAGEGEEYFRQALDILQHEPTQNYLFITQVKIHLSHALLAEGRLADAQQVAAEARDDALKHLGDQSPITKTAMDNLGSMKQAQ